jgi:AcrR family transcriptional regulator
VDHATALASRVGLEGVTIGQLADRLGMSKAGVLGHFGSKQALQLAAFRQATQAFTARVWTQASGRQPGLTRLASVCDAWLAYLADDTLPGGCFLTAASCEFDGRPGAVRDAIAAALTRWLVPHQATFARSMMRRSRSS